MPGGNVLGVVMNGKQKYMLERGEVMDAQIAERNLKFLLMRK